MASTTLHLRSETKDLERRSALSPTSAKTLLDQGYQINVERSSTRCYQDEEFEQVGATLVSEGSWEHAPKDHIIVGLKELPDASSALHHAHIQFGHCYKGQDGWEKYLSRFSRGSNSNGNGLLYDIEFLTEDDDTGRRVAAFGYYAGYAGAAISLLAWSHQVAYPEGPPLGAIPTYPSANALVDGVKSDISSVLSANKDQQHPRVIVIGALGRCGTGAVDFCLAAGIPESCILKWDVAETARGGPFPEITAADIFVNCVYVGANPIPPFVTRESLSVPRRKLRVICDVSCDPNNAHNPVPVYTEYSTFRNPTLPVSVDGDGPRLTVVSIDHLPSLVAREASDEVTTQLLPSLKTLHRRDEEGVWTRAEKLYREKIKELPVDA